MGGDGSSESYELEPDVRPPPAAPLAPPVIHHSFTDLSHTDKPCLRCGYNLRGLTAAGACPECGMPVSRSLQGNLLIFSSPEYLANLNRGLVIILVSVIARFAAHIASIGLAVVMVSAGGNTTILDQLVKGLTFPVAVLSLVGWWYFSAPDPAIVGYDTGDGPRKVVRWTVIIAAAATFAALGSSLLVSSSATPIGLSGIVGLATILSSAAGLVQFFASMMYVRWLGPRIPDRSITEKAAEYMWLLPLIYVLGACIVIGPFVAVIMYYVLLNKVRVKVSEIRARQRLETTAMESPVRIS